MRQAALEVSYVGAFGAELPILLFKESFWYRSSVVGFNGKQAIINSPILNFEITQTVSVGMFIKYQMAAFLGIFAITLLVQFVSYYFMSLSDYGESSKKLKEK